MNTCRIPKLSAVPDWSTLPRLALLPCRWSPNPPPTAYAALCRTEAGLLVRLESLAPPARAVNTEPDSPVWEDSCLEFFFSLDGETYVNLEGNANAALRASVGPDRHRRRLLRELGVPLPRAEAAVESERWSLQLEIPAPLFPALFGCELESGLRMTGNFYSCGDLTPAPHYAAWNEVATEKPDFHRPEYFGLLLFD